MRSKKFLLLFLLAGLTACATPDPYFNRIGNSAILGAGTGAAIGGLAGGGPGAATGAAIGGLAGGAFGALTPPYSGNAYAATPPYLPPRYYSAPPIPPPPPERRYYYYYREPLYPEYPPDGAWTEREWSYSFPGYEYRRRTYYERRSWDWDRDW